MNNEYETKIKAIEIHENEHGTYDVVAFKVDSGRTIYAGQKKSDPYRTVILSLGSYEQAKILAVNIQKLLKLKSYYDFVENIAVVDGVE